jgi:hypothetical protein
MSEARKLFAHAATTSRQRCRAFPARAPRSPPGVLGVKQEGPMTELYVFRGTTDMPRWLRTIKAVRNYRPTRSENGFFPEL